jgi:hypothetical protein
MSDALKPPIAPIGTVISLAGENRGSWLKINHSIDTPPDLMVQYFADAKKALDTETALRAQLAEAAGLLRDARFDVSEMEMQREGGELTNKIDAFLALVGDGMP